VAWFADESNKKLLVKFADYGVNPKVLEADTNGPLRGLSFVVTGSITGMSREQAADSVRSLGGVFQSSVGKGTTYLVAGGKIGSSKIAKAEKYGTKIIDEQAFFNLIKRDNNEA
jgi:DNA ligase (NAD+)